MKGILACFYPHRAPITLITRGLYSGRNLSCNHRLAGALPQKMETDDSTVWNVRGTNLIRIAMIGVGYWGPNLIRNFGDLDDAQVVGCSDLSQERLNKIAKRYPGVKCTQNYEELLADPDVDAVVIATPVSTHYPIAKAALEAGKHVMIEKPLADSSEHALDLVETAERVGRILMVDHTFIYTSAVRKMRELIDSGELGDILYFDSIRVNLGLFQRDVNVIWDLAPHDLSIMDYLLRAEPIAVSAIGASHSGNDIANIAYMTLRFPNNIIAHFHVNWLAPVKIRQTLLGCSKKMVVYDDVEPTDKIRVYDKGIVVNGGNGNGSAEKRYQAMVGYRTGDVLIPKIDTTEALQRVAQEFVSSINENRSPLTDGVAGYRVVRYLEAAQRSLENNGREVLLEEAAVEALVQS
jgi:predicted dehydrogenase